MGDRRARQFEPDPVHRLAELQPVLGHLDRRGIGADQLDPEPVERAVLVQRQRGVERGLPAHRRQQRVGPLLLADPGDHLGRDRLDIGRIRQLGVGHDRRRVRIDHDHAIALGLQRLDRLRSRIIELRRLPDDDRPRADDQDRGNVGALGHQPSGKLMSTNTAFRPLRRAHLATQTRCSSARRLPDHQQQLLLALVLDQLAQRQPAAASDIVELRLRCAGTGVAQAESKQRRKQRRSDPHFIAPTNFSNR